MKASKPFWIFLLSTPLTMLLMLLVIQPACVSYKNGQHEKLKIAYISKLENESFHDSIAKGVRQEMRTLNVEVDILPAKNQQDIDSQKAYLQEIATKRQYDGVMLAPNDSGRLVPFVKLLSRAKIPYLLVDTPLIETAETKNLPFDCGFIGTDNVLAGELAAKFVKEMLPRGNILLMRGNHNHRSSIDREAGFVKEMNAEPTFRIIDHVAGNWEEEAAYQAMSQYLRRNRAPIQVVFAYSDPMALGVSRYYKESPKQKRPLIVGVDGTLVGQKGVLRREIDATVVQAAEIMGKNGLRQMVECIKSPDKLKVVTLTPVTLLKSVVALANVTP